MTIVIRYDRVGVLDSDRVQRTPQGGIRVPARFTRVGVLPYELPDGTVRREYRPAEEVFKPESLATLIDAPITHLHPPTGKVDADTHSALSKGHVSTDVANEGNRYVGGSAVVQDGNTVRLVDERILVEISAGYTSRLDPTPGVSPDGEPYDVVQRDIKYNHVALLPRGDGRAGPEVSLRLDSSGHQLAPEQATKETNMELTPEELAALKALAAAAPQLMKLVPAAGATPAADNADDPNKTKVDEGEGGAAALTPEEVAAVKAMVAPKTDADEPAGDKPAEEVKTDGKAAPAAPAKTPEQIAQEQERVINDSIELRDKARKVLGEGYAFTGKSNKQVMTDVILHVDSKYSVAGKSNDALAAVFEMAISRHVERADSKSELAKVQQVTARLDSAEPAEGTVAGYLNKNISAASSRKAS